MFNRWKNGKAKTFKCHANPNGSTGSNTPLHVQRIGAETSKEEYNVPTSHRHLEQVMRYAELMGNHKKQGIKSPCDNKMEYEWKQLNEPIRISRRELLQNRGKAAIVNLLTSKGEIAETQMQENLTLGIFSDGLVGTGALSADQITGLRALLSTTVTYGGIAVAKKLAA